MEGEIEDINQHPLKQNEIARLNREFKAGISDGQLAKLVPFLREHDGLRVIKYAHESGLDLVVLETPLDYQDLPEDPIYTIEQLLSPDFPSELNEV